MVLLSIQSGPIALQVDAGLVVSDPMAKIPRSSSASASVYFSLHHTWYLWLMDIGTLVGSCWLQTMLFVSVWRQSVALHRFVMDGSESQKEQGQQHRQSTSKWDGKSDKYFEKMQRTSVQKGSIGTISDYPRDASNRVREPNEMENVQCEKTNSTFKTSSAGFKRSNQLERYLESWLWEWRALELPLRQNYCLSLTVANVCNVLAAVMRIKHMTSVYDGDIKRKKTMILILYAHVTYLPRRQTSTKESVKRTSFA